MNMTEKKPIRTQFREQIEKERLDDRQYELLQELLKNKGSGTREERDGSAWWRSLAAASVLLIIFTGYYLYNSETAAVYDNPVVMALADEVATNHIKINTPDIETSSIDQIRQHLDRLDFAPVLPAALPASDHLLKGGRYCTLQGRIAAQLMLTSAEGETITHYQAAYDREKFGNLPVLNQNGEPLLITKRGVEIRLWVEQDIVMAQARSVQ